MSFEAIQNLREMGDLPVAGGGRIKTGQLFRSGHLSSATDADLDRLTGLGLTTIIDFRTEVDHRGDGGPDRVPDGVDHLHLEVVDEGENAGLIRETLLSGDADRINDTFGGGRGEEIARGFVEALALEPAKQQVFARFLTTVADLDRRPVLWHCSAGKDRAGWAATVLGIALGADDETLIAHYLESNVHRPPEQRIAFYRERFGIDVSAATPLLGVREDYLRAGLAAIDGGWSSREAYLDEALGFGPDRIDRLRDELITGRA